MNDQRLETLLVQSFEETNKALSSCKIEGTRRKVQQRLENRLFIYGMLISIFWQVLLLCIGFMIGGIKGVVYLSLFEAIVLGLLGSMICLWMLHSTKRFNKNGRV